MTGGQRSVTTVIMSAREPLGRRVIAVHHLGGNSVPTGSAPGGQAYGRRRARSGALLTGLLALLTLGVITAGPALAVGDGTRPDAHVTNGPSCRPGGVVVQVVAGSVPYHVVLATTRSPQGEDAVDVAPGQTAVLHSRDVDWGETIDSRLEFTALDGSGVTYADELDGWTFTRPALADCAAVSSPAAGVVPSVGVAADDPGAPRPAGSRGPDAVHVQVLPAADQAGVAPIRTASPWPPLISAVALLGAAGGVVLALRRRSLP